MHPDAIPLHISPMPYVIKFVGLPCRRCSKNLVSKGEWSRIPLDQRDHSNNACHQANQLCRSCWRALAQPVPTVRVRRPIAHTVEDWEELRREGYTRAQAAERLGMTRAAFDKALARYYRVNAA